MITTQDIDTITGGTVHGRDGNKIGPVGHVYLDNASGNPEWVTVKTGLFRGNAYFVPLAQATVADGHLTVPFGKATVKDAPRTDDDTELTPTHEEQLYSYYGMPSTPGTPTTTTGTGTGTGRTVDTVDTDPNSHGMVDAQADATGAAVGTRTGRTGTGTGATTPRETTPRETTPGATTLRGRTPTTRSPARRSSCTSGPAPSRSGSTTPGTPASTATAPPTTSGDLRLP